MQSTATVRRTSWPSIGLLVVLVALAGGADPAPLAQTRLSMLPPQSSSPSDDVYPWGDTLTMSVVVPEGGGYSAGFIFDALPDPLRQVRSIRGDRSRAIIELPLTDDAGRFILDLLDRGRAWVHGRAVLRHGEAIVAERRFWILNPARRWPDALALTEAGRDRDGMLSVRVELPDDRRDEPYALDLVRLPMRIAGGTVSMEVAQAASVEITPARRLYRIAAPAAAGVYEVRLRGPGGFVHDVARLQLPELVPQAELTDTGLVTEAIDETLSIRFFSGQVALSGVIDPLEPGFKLMRVSAVQVASAALDEVRPDQMGVATDGRWTKEIRATSPGRLAVLTRHLDDEIVLTEAQLGAAETRESVPRMLGDSRVLRPGEALHFRAGDYHFAGSDKLWIILRRNLSARRPYGTPAGYGDQVVRRWLLSAGSPELTITAPDKAEEYRLDIEDVGDDGEPGGRVKDTHPFSVIGDSEDACLAMPQDPVVMGAPMAFRVELAERSFAAPVTVEAVRPAGRSSAGQRHAPRTPPVGMTAFRRELWRFGEATGLYPPALHNVEWDTFLWAPGTYEARVVLGEAPDRARVIGRARFEVVVPHAPGAVTAVNTDAEDPNRLHVEITVPEWGRRGMARALSIFPYTFHTALVRPALKTAGNALRHEEVLDMEEIRGTSIPSDGTLEVELNRPAAGGVYEAHLLVNVTCFASVCPTAVLDRLEVELPAPGRGVEPAPDHIADRFVFPADPSLDRQGRAFPDLVHID